LQVEATRDRAAIEAHLRRDPAANLYALADLDDFFWRETRWYAARESGEIRALCLLLETLDPPILVALDSSGTAPLRELLEASSERLPGSFFLNLSPPLKSLFEGRGKLRWHGLHQKMILSNRRAIESEPARDVVRLAPADLEELQHFYQRDAYTNDERDARFFEPYMLEQGPYFGVRAAGQLIAVGGVHVRSASYGVAAIGNLATRPDRRRRGHGRTIVAAICRELHAIPHIGLNVEVDNRAAIACYEALGFREVCRYLEATVSGWHP
jgi:ribosomal protein S18 acetylase RimI-like enzyme